MPTLDFESDAQLITLTDALRAGPGSPQWRDAVARVREGGGDQADEYLLLCTAREHLASGRSYREIHAGPGFSRKVMEGVEEEGRGRPPRVAPTAGMIAVISGLVVAAVVASAGYFVWRNYGSNRAPAQDLGDIYFTETVLDVRLDGPPAGWRRVGALPLTFDHGLRPGHAPAGDAPTGNVPAGDTRPGNAPAAQAATGEVPAGAASPDNASTGAAPAGAADAPAGAVEFVGGALVWEQSILPSKAMQIDVTLRLPPPESKVVAQVFVTDDPSLSDARATSPHELAWTCRAGAFSVALPSGRVEAAAAGTLSNAQGVEVRIQFDARSAAIDTAGSRLWSGAHGLDPGRPRFIGVRFLAPAGAKADPAAAIESIRLKKPKS